MVAFAIVGLLLNLFGTVTLTLFGFPQPDLSEPPQGVAVVYGTNPDFEAESVRIQKRRDKRNLKSRVGLIVVSLGFVLQLIAYL